MHTFDPTRAALTALGWHVEVLSLALYAAFSSRAYIVALRGDSPELTEFSYIVFEHLGGDDMVEVHRGVVRLERVLQHDAEWVAARLWVEGNEAYSRRALD